MKRHDNLQKNRGVKNDKRWVLILSLSHTLFVGSAMFIAATDGFPHWASVASGVIIALGIIGINRHVKDASRSAYQQGLNDLAADVMREARVETHDWDEPWDRGTLRDIANTARSAYENDDGNTVSRENRDSRED